MLDISTGFNLHSKYHKVINVDRFKTIRDFSVDLLLLCLTPIGIQDSKEAEKFSQYLLEGINKFFSITLTMDDFLVIQSNVLNRPQGDKHILSEFVSNKFSMSVFETYSDRRELTVRELLDIDALQSKLLHCFPKCQMLDNFSVLWLNNADHSPIAVEFNMDMTESEFKISIIKACTNYISIHIDDIHYEDETLYVGEGFNKFFNTQFSLHELEGFYYDIIVPEKYNDLKPIINNSSLLIASVSNHSDTETAEMSKRLGEAASDFVSTSDGEIPFNVWLAVNSEKYGLRISLIDVSPFN